jgi:tetratricopeptide (TPR) repeat protein
MASDEQKQTDQQIVEAGLRFQIGMSEVALERDANDTEALRFLAHAYGVAGRNAERLSADERLAALLPHDPRAHYNLACSHALVGHIDDAIAALEQACGLGFADPVLLRRDEELDSLREDPRFQAIERLIADE